jgi:hypothetical protein
MGASASLLVVDESPELTLEIQAEYDELKKKEKSNEEIEKILKEKFGPRLEHLKCTHPYLNKWDGIYVCMDCNYRLEAQKDKDRINNEETMEKNTPYDVIPEGMSVGKLSQMRGVSIKFLLQFTQKHDCWSWNSWNVIRKIIKPETESKRCRYVELDSMKNNVGPAQTFISYAQAGTWGDLVAAVADEADVNRFVWIDVFAIRQWPSSSPDLDFRSTIENC